MQLGTNKEPEEKDIQIEGKSRYKNSVLLQSEDFLFIALPIHTRDTSERRPLEVNHVTSKGEEGKIDNISYKYYRTSYLWDRICKASQVLNPLRVEAGSTLRVPHLEDL